MARNLALASALAAPLLTAGCARQAPGTYRDPAEAVGALSSLLGSGDEKAFEDVFGPGAKEMFESGDPVADKVDAEKVKSLLGEKSGLEDMDEKTKILVLGNDAWPFPIPLVKEGEIWRFDSVAGREEIANRRVGRNELHTIASLHALVDAQHEYRSEGRDGNPAAYARRFLSTEGKHDGLYWPTVEGEPISPLGDLVAEAAGEGYTAGGGERRPFHGYYFKMLEGQGKSAPGGARTYLDDAGQMSRGFAAVAWPAKHGMSGIMTFIVSERGIIFQKDLGDQTDAVASAMSAFDPDTTWAPTWDPDDVPATPAADAASPEASK